MPTCPQCGTALKERTAVCANCLSIVDRERWDHDAGRLGSDNRGAGRPLEDPPVGPVPLTAGGGDIEGGFFASAFRLFGTGRLLKWGKRR